MFSFERNCVSCLKTVEISENPKKTLKLQHADIKWLKRMDLSGSVSVVEKTQCEGKVGENWIPRLSLGGECHGLDLPTREGQPQEKPLD